MFESSSAHRRLQILACSHQRRRPASSSQCADAVLVFSAGISTCRRARERACAQEQDGHVPRLVSHAMPRSSISRYVNVASAIVRTHDAQCDPCCLFTSWIGWSCVSAYDSLSHLVSLRLSRVACYSTSTIHSQTSQHCDHGL